MLAHLVCIDRRYQRMNCFNIRELQSMLRQKYFNDLVEDSVHFTSMNDSMIKLRFKANSTNLFQTDISSGYMYGLTVTDKIKYEVFNKNGVHLPISLHTTLITRFRNAQ